MGMDQYLLIPFLGEWTSINPSYFDVNYRGTIGFDTLPYHYISYIIITILSPLISLRTPPCLVPRELVPQIFRPAASPRAFAHWSFSQRQAKTPAAFFVKAMVSGMPRCSMYGIFAYKTGWFLGQMLVSLPYMEHMRFKPGINGIEWDSNGQFSGIFKIWLKDKFIPEICNQRTRGFTAFKFYHVLSLFTYKLLSEHQGECRFFQLPKSQLEGITVPFAEKGPSNIFGHTWTHHLHGFAYFPFIPN